MVFTRYDDNKQTLLFSALENLITTPIQIKRACYRTNDREIWVLIGDITYGYKLSY